MSNSYRCYLKFRKGTRLSPGKQRKGIVHWQAASSPDEARALVEAKYLDQELRPGEWHESTVATKKPEDEAMRAQGYKGLFD